MFACGSLRWGGFGRSQGRRSQVFEKASRGGHNSLQLSTLPAGSLEEGWFNGYSLSLRIGHSGSIHCTRFMTLGTSFSLFVPWVDKYLKDYKAFRCKDWAVGDLASS